MRARALVVVASVSSLFAFLSPRAAKACSICGCDPAAGMLGLDRPSAQTLRVQVEDRYLAKESGAGEDRESERENRLVLRAQYAPAIPVVFQLEVPVFLWKDHLDAAGVRDDRAFGLGDVSLSARTELFRSGGMVPRHVVSLIGAVKTPTGANAREGGHDHGSAAPVDVPIDEHLQLGTGSWDGLLTLSYAFGPQPWTLFANATGRLNSENSRGFRYGHAAFFTGGARRAFLDGGKLILSLEAQLRTAGKDRFGDGGFDEDSGGEVLYATASAAYALTNDLLLRGIVQVPTVTRLNGTQSEHPVGYLTLGYDFAL